MLFDEIKAHFESENKVTPADCKWLIAEVERLRKVERAAKAFVEFNSQENYELLERALEEAK